MARRTSTILGVGAAFWLIGPMLLGSNVSGVALGNPGVTWAVATDQPGALPACVSAHTYDSRSWPGVQTLQAGVWVTGCKDAAGQMRVTSGPTCEATSLLGPGTATCTATSEGDHLKVVVHISYPFGLDWIAGRPSTTAFTLDSSGWTAVAP
jgi:hypothetical protein